MPAVEEGDAEPEVVAGILRASLNILYDEKQLELGGVEIRVVLVLRHIALTTGKPEGYFEAKLVQGVQRISFNGILLDEEVRPGLAEFPYCLAVFGFAPDLQNQISVGRAVTANNDLFALVLIHRVALFVANGLRICQRVLCGPLAQSPGRLVLVVAQIQDCLDTSSFGCIGIAEQEALLELGVGEEGPAIIIRFFPGADVFDAVRRGQVGVFGQAEPVGHCLAVEIQGEGLIPVGVFDPANEYAVEIPFDLLGVPFEGVCVVVVGEVGGGCPDSALRPVLILGGGSKDVQVHIVFLLEPWCAAADFEYVDFCPEVRGLVIEPERAGAGGCHRPALDLEIAVLDQAFALDCGGGVGVIAFVFRHRGRLVLSHSQVESAVGDRDVGGVEPRGLPSEPRWIFGPPLVGVEFAGIEFIAHRVVFHPAGLIGLIGKGIGIGYAFECWAGRAGSVPARTRFLFGEELAGGKQDNKPNARL